jgi:hypothetical protein
MIVLYCVVFLSWLVVLCYLCYLVWSYLVLHGLVVWARCLIKYLDEPVTYLFRLHAAARGGYLEVPYLVLSCVVFCCAVFFHSLL